MEKLPPEINRLIYSFINPISKPIIRQKNVVWCKSCGEILEKGEWYVSVSQELGFMAYCCSICEYENIFDIEEEGDKWDIIIKQEVNN
tara:strand:+ start:7304 stop:7567 length:264 start_codon:yes stop_codon:yes gene_type:complete